MSAPIILPPARHEPTNGLPKIVVLTGGGIAVGLALVLLVAAWVMRADSRQGKNSRAQSGVFSFENGPLATTGVAQDWIAQDRAVRDHLQNYGWVDRGTGVVRIPIDRAIELLAGETTAGSAPVHRGVTP